MNKAFRVVHISDIHFRSGFPHHQWQHVKDVLRIERPHALIATGDFVESPWPLMLILARREMLHFAGELGIPLIAIPGNHDVAFIGFAPIWPFTRLYARIFGGGNDEWITAAFPTFTQFYGKNFIERSCWRLSLYAKILWRWVSGQLKRGGSREAILTVEDRIPLKVVGFDSNCSLFLASGSVSSSQINAFGSHAFQLENNSEIAATLRLRVALIHHHLVPIPYTRSEISGHEPLLVMRNAGTMLKELWNHDFDLVLHGHRHYFSFTRISFDRSVDGGRELAVLSAASPTTAEPEAKSNSFHLLDFRPNGVVKARKVAFGTDATVHGERDVGDPWFEAISLRSVKPRNHRRMVRLMNHSCDLIEQDLRIDPAGVAHEVASYHGLQVRAGGELRRRLFTSRVDRGSLDAVAFHESRTLWSPGCFLSEPRTSAADPHVVRVSVDFNPPLNEDRSLSFGICSTIPNSIAMSRWEISTFPGTRRNSGGAGNAAQPSALYRELRA